MTGSQPVNIAADSLPKILFVDDEERILRSRRPLFRNRYEVLTTTDGYVALEYLKQNKVSVIVSDQRMPVMLGVDLLRQAKVIAPNTIRILLTGYSDLAAIVSSINDGEVYRFINKPWSNQDIQRVVDEAVAVSLRLGEQVAPPLADARADEIPQMDEAVLVVSPFRPLHEEVVKLVGGKAKVVRALSLREVLNVLQFTRVGVIAAESHPEHEDITLFLKLLKQRYPEIVTFLVSPSADAEMAINLINQAQIYRFLTPPLTSENIRSALAGAMRQFSLIKSVPERADMYRVEAQPEAAAASASGVAKWLADGIRGLPLGRLLGRG